MADVTFSDVNGDGSLYQVADADLSTLAGTTVVDPDYKGMAGHLSKLDFVNLPANDYDPVAQAAALQSQIDALTAQLAPLQAIATNMAKIVSPAIPADPAQPDPATFPAQPAQ
jgi:hypothetical protein